ncbi:helix-turn-helix domain-containing protein [Daejeonella lutea]|uniref:Transcriptional regulatory protein, C terminal n=1 Tax=Daejeonella lutea TaxID=572036 RepID=A0A1T5EX64_9SPHI|nr:helix-turn-helix domain-containing protein [Daejeonella lutea]SKB88409.1 Transcriptional regulatory protein, C terminal [Daejeonella lutea]
MNLRYLYAALIALSVFSTAILYVGKSDEYERSRELIAFRQVGHQILLSANDSSSRVLPVSISSSNQYQLEFEHAFAIVPDSLVKSVNRVMQKNKISTDYVVNVLDSKSNKLVYGFAISRTSDNIVPCMGRVLPEKKYKINIIPEAKPTSIVARNKFPLFAFFLLISISGATFFSRRKNTDRIAGASVLQSRPILIGEYSFYPDSLLLMHHHTPFVLTPKENKLLRIFAGDINKIIDRNQLLKKGWEDEGVITQRSLDMYVSRLRKKLVNDASVKITNVHGKGYLLSTKS